MKLSLIVVAIVAITGLEGCGPIAVLGALATSTDGSGSKAKPEIEMPIATQTTIKPVITVSMPSVTEACSTRDDASLAKDRLVQRDQIRIERVFQRVVRYDCDHKVKSDRTETVQSPFVAYTLKPKSLWLGTSVFSSSAYNRTACSTQGLPLDDIVGLLITPLTSLAKAEWQGLKTKLGFPSIELTLDTSPTVGHMQVDRDRKNYIDYEFTKCLDAKESEDSNGKNVRECVKSEPIEKGTLILTVKYSERTLSNTKEIDECKVSEN
jgi:hypothetical protein